MSKTVTDDLLKENKKDGLIAEKCLFQGISGYTVKQFRDGKIAAEQFIREDEYEQYCQKAGVRPVIAN